MYMYICIYIWIYMYMQKDRQINRQNMYIHIYYIYIYTVDEFHQRWNNYKSNDRKFQRLEPCMQEHLFSHFSMACHDGFLNDASITFIDKTDPCDPLRREDYWRQTFKTMVPYGLNIEDSV